MATTLIIADIHNRIEEADQLLDRWYDEVDDVVVLGDYFDSFDDTDPALATATASWLHARVTMPRITWLWGNHDLPYAFPTALALQDKTHGWRALKAKAIQDALGTWLEPRSPVWRTLKVATARQGWLISHAGISNWWWCGGRGAFTPEDWETLLNEKFLYECKHRLPYNSPPGGWLWGPGRRRGGSEDAGGILWCDWAELKTYPYPGLKQIVGHTVSSKQDIVDSRLVKVDGARGVGHAIIRDGVVELLGPHHDEHA